MTWNSLNTLLKCNKQKVETLRGDEHCFLVGVLVNVHLDRNIIMELLYLQTSYAHILENQKHYAEFHFGILDQFMIDVIEYLFSEAYTLNTVEVVIA